MLQRKSKWRERREEGKGEERGRGEGRKKRGKKEKKKGEEEKDRCGGGEKRKVVTSAFGASKEVCKPLSACRAGMVQRPCDLLMLPRQAVTNSWPGSQPVVPRAISFSWGLDGSIPIANILVKQKASALRPFRKVT